MTLPLFLVRDLVCGEDSVFSSPERIVALCIADHMNTNAEAWPSVRTIGAWTGLGQTAVKGALRSLCTGPRAVFQRRPGPRAGLDSTRYTLAEVGHKTTGSPHDRVAKRPEGGRHATLGGSPRDHKGPNEGPIEGPNQQQPPKGTVAALEARLAGGRW